MPPIGGSCCGLPYSRGREGPWLYAGFGRPVRTNTLKFGVIITSAIHLRAALTLDLIFPSLLCTGLADAGLHNLFCSNDRVWFFDLGEPTLTSVPAFLTKFLFSFFHTLGMQEPEADNTTWVRRFEHNKRSQKLKLTEETSTLLSQSYDAFGVALDRIVNEIFDGEDSARWLLMQYMTLQLVSDASFCLQKWTIKVSARAFCIRL